MHALNSAKLLSPDKVIFDNLLGRKENAKNDKTCSWVGIALAVYVFSISLMNLINTDLLSSAGPNIGMAYAQLEQPQSSNAPTPFLEWYESQKDNLQSGLR